MALVTVEAPFRDFVAFWERAHDRPREEQAAAWRRDYAARHPALLAYYERMFGDADGVLPDALARYPDVAHDLEARFAALDLDRAGREVAELVGLEVPVRAIALVGTFTAEAWMDEFEGRPAVFFALETLADRGRARVAGLHELAHAAHERARGEPWADDVAGLVIMLEAFAYAVPVRLAPDVAMEHQFGVPDFAAWRRACAGACREVAAELLERLDDADDRAIRRLFWPDWGRDEHDVPERCGYYVAARVADALLAEHELAEIARWRAGRALREVRGALEALA